MIFGAVYCLLLLESYRVFFIVECNYTVVLNETSLCSSTHTYADNVALPAFVCHCCSNRSILVSPAGRAHSSKPAAAALR